MLKHSRVSGSLDTARLGAAIAGPGMDTRTWVSLAVVNSITIDPDEGVFADVTLMPSGLNSTARVAHEYTGDGFGVYAPIMVDDEVLVEAPNGDPDQGLILTRRLYSASDKPPSEALDNPEDLLIVVRSGKSMRILTDDGVTEIRSRDGEAHSLALQSKLNELENKVNSLINVHNTHIHVLTLTAGTGTAAVPAIVDTPIVASTGTNFLKGE